MSDALVLAGALWKGAFTAGALQVLSDPDVKARHAIDIRRIVGASSGALNAAFLAGAIRAGREADAGARLAQLWVDDATLGKVFDVAMVDLLGGRGISDSNRLLALLRANVPAAPGVTPIDLRIVVTNADGEAAPLGDGVITTYEHVVALSGPDFDTPAAIERVYAAAVASSALPGVFAPVDLDIGGKTVHAFDGGLTNNTPLGHAFEDAPDISRVFVVVPFPRLRETGPTLSGVALASHIFDMLIEERLSRELRSMVQVNQGLAALPQLLPDAAQRGAVLDALGWSQRRVVEVVEIRPPATLPGDSFSGLWSRDLRQSYVQTGIDAARAVLQS
ncbi:MAG TPA: patatin-like phospholipase family protein [Polyangiaceae bacterium]